MKPYPAHPFADIFPMHEGQPLWDLRADIEKNGQLETIWLYQGMVLDGRRRQAALFALGIKPKYKTFKGTEAQALDFVISKNLKRRHLGEAERAMIAAKYATLKSGQHKSASSDEEAESGGSKSREDAAKALNVSKSAVDRARTLEEDGSKTLKNAVADGVISLTRAAELAKLPKLEQNAAVKEARKPPEKPKPEEAVPARLKKYFESVATFESAARKAVALANLFQEIEKTPAYLIAVKGKKHREYSTYIRSAGRAIKLMTPKCPCPECGGAHEPSEEADLCKTCANRGYLTVGDA